MDASLLALGITLFAAALVPLTYGGILRGAAIATLGSVSWGAGIGATLVGVLGASTTIGCLILLTGGTVRIARRRNRLRSPA